ncbi:MAG: carbonic anhydrase [Pirellulales bacterium]
MPFIAPNRRQWMAGTAACGFTAVSSGSWPVRATDQATSPAIPSPQDGLAQLFAGNRRFVQGASLAPHRDVHRLREVAPRQTPFAAFLGCADSRVPIEIVFDQGFGDLFVTRIAGNVASTENIASLEFATHVLGCSVLFVLGHTSCGAVTAAARREPVPGQISSLFQLIRPAVRTAQGNVELAIRENVRVQATTLVEASTVISTLVAQRKLIVAGGIYDLTTGRVDPVDLE